MLENALKASKFWFSVVNGPFSEKYSLGAPEKGRIGEHCKKMYQDSVSTGKKRIADSLKFVFGYLALLETTEKQFSRSVRWLLDDFLFFTKNQCLACLVVGRGIFLIHFLAF